jgi:fusion and transport protein UGO1
VISTAVIGVLLSPLELIRTRLIVQHNDRKRYYGPFHAFYRILKDESTNVTSIASLYNMRILLPSLLVYTISPLINVMTSQYIEQELGLDQDFTPLLYQTAKIAALGLESLIITPFEFARKRMFVQDINAFKTNLQSNDIEQSALVDTVTFETCIETSPVVYTGIANCIVSVVQEEGGKEQKISENEEWENVYGNVLPKVRKSPYGQGVFSLYRGFWTRYASSVIKYISNDNPELVF